MSTRRCFFIGLLVSGIVVWAAFFFRPSPSAEEFTRKIRIAIARSPDEGWEIAQRGTAVYPRDAGVLLMAAEAAARAKHVPELIRLLNGNESLLLNGQGVPGNATLQTLIDSGYHRLAEELLTERLRHDQDDLFALRKRSELLLSQGRHDSASADLRRLLSEGQINLDELVFLCSRREFLEDRAGLHRAATVEPKYWPPITGLGSLAAFEGDLDEALKHLRQAVLLQPSSAQAWASMGLVYYRKGQLSSEFRTWRTEVLSRECDHPDVHFVMAWLASQEADYSKSVKRLCRALQLAPLHRPACQLLSTILSQHSPASDHAEFLAERAATIHETEELAHAVLFGDRNSVTMSKLAANCEKLGDAQLALAWWQASDLFRGSLSIPRQPSVTQRRTDVQQNSVITANRLKSILSQGINDQFRVDRRKNVATHNASTLSSADTPAVLQFQDIAGAVGITDPYHHGLENLESGLWIYQGFGGGVGIIDLDGDDVPDFCFTQACRWNSDSELPWHQQDLLYRNRQGRFEQVNHLAFDSENSFGQGIAVGDVDRDGFPDIYVANIGANRLLLNNGDGTFRTMEMPIAEDGLPGWTTSCMLADLDGDGLDDLFNVQYVEGYEPFERICPSGSEGLVRGCLPTLFDPAHDEFLRNQGDGRFRDETISSGLAEYAGRGLGVLAANLDGVAGLEVFVSNDMSPNHLLRIQNTEAGIEFDEVANLVGLARNGEGQVEACMGIAAADFSGDGGIDLVVTNFFEETNTCYASQPGGFFLDQTRRMQLGAVSLKKLGFGTQPLDADLDADADLLIVNGHVDDFRHSEIPWKMSADLMQNAQNSGFQRCSQESLTEYGVEDTLARAVATVDWNRDGRLDAVVTHLDRHPALLENRTQTDNHFLSLCLTGTDSNRRGVGTHVTITTGNGTQRFQRMAGDGYYCSNDHHLLMGIGTSETVKTIEIRWPSGVLQRFVDVPANCRMHVIEGRNALYRLRP